jgi:hypothetical protein
LPFTFGLLPFTFPGRSSFAMIEVYGTARNGLESSKTAKETLEETIQK